VLRRHRGHRVRPDITSRVRQFPDIRISIAKPIPITAIRCDPSQSALDHLPEWR
jgi:hypothetical protein